MDGRQSKKELESFHGMVNYLKQYFSTHTGGLTIEVVLGEVLLQRGRPVIYAS